jgi:hypothetical protein
LGSGLVLPIENIFIVLNPVFIGKTITFAEYLFYTAKRPRIFAPSNFLLLNKLNLYQNETE